MSADTEALILFAHGARDPGWRAPLDALAQRMRAVRPGGRVSVAFLELMTPSLGDAIDEAVAGGALRIAIAPVFWASGGHLKHDVPLLLEAARTRHPGLRLELWPALGESEAVLDAIAGAYARLWKSGAPTR